MEPIEDPDATEETVKDLEYFENLYADEDYICSEDDECRCKEGYFGNDCSEELNQCFFDELPCNGKGKCQKNGCKCNKPFTGDSCETGGHECFGIPGYCQNGGKCHPEHGCKCKKSFQGD